MGAADGRNAGPSAAVATADVAAGTVTVTRREGAGRSTAGSLRAGAAGRTVDVVVVLADLGGDRMIVCNKASFGSGLGFNPAVCSKSRIALSVFGP